MKFIGILLLITSCAGNPVNDLFKIDTESDPRKTLTTDETFLTYITDFEIDAAYHADLDMNVHNIPVNFADLDKRYLGACYYYGKAHQWREIKIDREQWEELDEAQRKALIYHELGHCALNRKHKDEHYRSFPVSIMNTYHIGSNYEKYSEEYNYELFTEDESILTQSIDKDLEL